MNAEHDDLARTLLLLADLAAYEALTDADDGFADLVHGSLVASLTAPARGQ